MQSDVVEAALTGIRDGGDAGDAAFGFCGGVDEEEVAFSLCDEDAGVGEEGEGPWFREVGYGCCFEGLLAGG